jgi:membrane protein insertase Oxa1/YidC/SpoIIIJ
MAGGLTAYPLASSIRQARYASTTPAITPGSEIPSDPASILAGTNSSSLPELSSFDMTGNELLNMTEGIGYLKALGLDFGWGPTACMEWLLEHTYVLTGLPWWASIGAVAFMLRAAIFVPSLWSAEQSQKIQDLRKIPKYDEATKRFQQSLLLSKDQTAMMEARREVLMIEKAEGVKKWMLGIPMVNAVFAFGMFRLIKAMAALPVPSLETGGLLWFSDLTVHDPLYILPLVSAAAMFLSMRVSPFPCRSGAASTTESDMLTRCTSLDGGSLHGPSTGENHSHGFGRFPPARRHRHSSLTRGRATLLPYLGRFASYTILGSLPAVVAPLGQPEARFQDRGARRPGQLVRQPQRLVAGTSDLEHDRAAGSARGSQR